jgi:DNA-binding CsgD family transcriptional regulator
MSILPPQPDSFPPAANQPQPALAALTPIQQQAIALRKDGLSFGEIAERLDCTEVAALCLVRRASAKLKQTANPQSAPKSTEFAFSNPAPLQRNYSPATARSAAALASASGTRVGPRAAEG